MAAWIWAIVVIAVLVVAGVVLWAVWTSRRSKHLRSTFGGEYERTVRATGSRKEAETELSDREKRHEELDIRPLSPASRDRYAASWREVQTQFVDAPDAAVREAQSLVLAVMRERGYPMDDFEQQAADISVDYPDVVENYRAAHRISGASDDGRATTEDLRQAMRHYRALFDELLAEVDEAAGETSDERARTAERERVS